MEEKDIIDHVYHFLRLLSNEENPEAADAVSGLSSHLLGDGDYPALLRYLKYYGDTYLIDTIYQELDDLEFDRIIEFGSGLAWLSNGIAARRGMTPVITVDKRPWGCTSVIADLEKHTDRRRIADSISTTDIIVMSEFLHCLEDPMEVMASFTNNYLVIVEYMPLNKQWRASYCDQLVRYNACSMSADFLNMMFGERVSKVVDIDPYVLLIVRPK